MGLETGVTDTAHSLAPGLVHVRHRLTEGEHMNPGVMIAIVGEGMDEEDHQDHRGGIRTGLTHGRARGHLSLAEGIGCPQGDGHRVTSVGGQAMEGEHDGLDLGVTRCDRVGQGRGLTRVLAPDRGRILRIQGIVGVGRGRAAEEGGLSVISGIAGRGRRDFFRFVLFILAYKICFVWYPWEAPFQNTPLVKM